MDESEDRSLHGLIQTFNELKENLNKAVSEENDTKADKVALKYEEQIEHIRSYNVNSIQDYKSKIQFFFEILLMGEGNKALLSKFQKSLISDLSKFNVI